MALLTRLLSMVHLLLDVCNVSKYTDSNNSIRDISKPPVLILIKKYIKKAIQENDKTSTIR